MLLRVQCREPSHQKPFMPSEDNSKESSQMSGRGVLGWLTLSKRQAVIRFKAVAEQNEGLRGGRVGKVDHLHAAFQKELVTQVEQMLLLHCYAGLRRHLLKECLHPERIKM